MFNENDLKFSTAILNNDTTIFGFDEHLGKTLGEVYTKTRSQIEWEVELEARSWGIKGIDIKVKKIAIEIEYDFDNEMDEKETDFYYLDVDESDEQWKIVNEVAIGDNRSVFPAELQIDFTTKTIEVK